MNANKYQSCLGVSKPMRWAKNMWYKCQDYNIHCGMTVCFEQRYKQQLNYPLEISVQSMHSDQRKYIVRKLCTKYCAQSMHSDPRNYSVHFLYIRWKILYCGVLIHRVENIVSKVCTKYCAQSMHSDPQNYSLHFLYIEWKILYC